MTKRLSALILGMAGLGWGMAVMLMYVVDPLQIGKHDAFDPALALTNMRLQARGLIRNHPFDSVILGTSMLENTSAKEAAQRLGGTWMNLSMSGSDFYERSFVLAYLFRTKPCRQVVYSLDAHFLDRRMGRDDMPVENWSYLYDEDENDYVRLYFNQWVIRQYIHRCLVRSSPFDFDRPTAWFSDPSNACRFGGIKNWVGNMQYQGLKDFISAELPEQASMSASKRKDVRDTGAMEQATLAYIETHLLRFVREHPDTVFHLVFPPYMRYMYAKWRQNDPERFFLYQACVRYLAGMTKACPNLFVYGFETESFLDDIAVYKDTMHYAKEINTYMLDCMRTGKHRLDAENVDAYLKRCDDLAFGYDIGALHRRFQDELKRQGIEPGRD